MAVPHGAGGDEGRAFLIVELAEKRQRFLTSRSVLAAPPGQSLLHLIEERLVDDRFVLALMDLIRVPNLTSVDWV
ncbi:hypothetical protein NOG11_14830 [Parvularcula sp. BGMRC 0090]|uniref:Uncharacterized protein n=1 Tax=Parvularcula maris TaxID=2965077 RepID=A0A9X2LBY1_9PROT|nr:hypothetical protein [Parvularcula maris]MCQ8186654.1 hypothetical protein [Parvularcula maris]